MPANSLENKMLAVRVRWLIASFCFVIMALTTGCVGGRNSPIITPSEALVSPNQRVQFTAQAAEGTRLWLVNGVPGGASSFGTITATGMYTAPEVPNPGSFNTAIRVSVIVNGAESFSVPYFFIPTWKVRAWNCFLHWQCIGGLLLNSGARRSISTNSVWLGHKLWSHNLVPTGSCFGR